MLLDPPFYDFQMPQWGVPYVLKLLAETEEGIDCLKRSKVVSSSGSVTPDELGDRLTKEGVFLGSHFAS